MAVPISAWMRVDERRRLGVTFPDPGAASAGADAEAGGTPPDANMRAMGDAEPSRRLTGEQRSVYPLPFLMLMIFVIFAVAIVAYIATIGH
jgi:hypothetical protein